MKKLIKKFNAWIEKVGVDKLLHFFVAAWLVAECKMYGVMWGYICFAVVSILSVAKELYVDEDSDLNDAWVSVLGGFCSMMLLVVKDLVG